MKTQKVADYILFTENESLRGNLFRVNRYSMRLSFTGKGEPNAVGYESALNKHAIQPLPKNWFTING